MQSTNSLLIGLAMAAFTFSAAVQAHGDGDRGTAPRDTPRAEQHGHERRPLEPHTAQRQRADRRSDGSGLHHRQHAAHGHGFAHWVDTRQHRQAHRIRDGWRAGELTRSEAHRLSRQQARIARQERRFLADGHLNQKERRHLDRALDRAGRTIHRARHNARQRDVHAPVRRDWS